MIERLTLFNQSYPRTIGGFSSREVTKNSSLDNKPQMKLINIVTTFFTKLFIVKEAKVVCTVMSKIEKRMVTVLNCILKSLWR